MHELIEKMQQSDIRLVFAFIFALLITWYSIPAIVKAARSKNLFDEPNQRTSHKGKVPTLGGIAIFAGFFIPVLLFTHTSDFQILPYMLAGAMIIFFIGVKDDILELSPLKKLYGQLIAALVVILIGDLRFTNLHGFMDIYELPYFVSVLITLFTIVVIVNSFNLVDGIDGLAAGLALVASVFLGLWFYEVGQMELAIVACSLIGTLLAYLRFNFIYTRYKVFMGDTGSLLLGFVVATLTIEFNELNITGNASFLIGAAPAVSFSILIVPLFDTMRVFVVRLYRNCSPFKPDRTHIHHILLGLGFSHGRATFTLMTVNILIVEFAWYFNYLGTMKLMMLLLGIGLVLTLIPYILLVRRRRRQQHENGNHAKPVHT